MKKVSGRKNDIRITVAIGLILAMRLVYAQAAEIDLVPLQTVKKVAINNATSMWGEVYATEPITYYDLNDEIVAYMFNFRREKPFPDHTAIQSVTTQADPWGKGEYCHITINARYSEPPIEEYAECLSLDIVWREKMDMMAEEELGTSSVKLSKIYFINPFLKWFLYVNENGTDSVYVKPTPPPKTYSPADFEEKVRKHFLEWFEELEQTQESTLKQTDYSMKWAEQEVEVEMSNYEIRYLPMYDLMPFYDWHLGCVPTAASMCLGYYDKVGILPEFNNYGRLVAYHYSEDGDTQIPDILPVLADKMETNSEGETSRLKVSDAIEELVKEKGYSCDADGHGSLGGGAYFADPSYRGDLVDEINAGRPCMFHLPGHSTAAVGYKKEAGEGDADEVVVHNTWNDTLQWFNCGRSRKGYCLFTIELSDPGSGTIELTSPLGDVTYNGNGNAGELLRGRAVYYIRWRTNNDGYGQVEIRYNSPETGNMFIDQVSNTGSYPWTIPSNIPSTTDGRIFLRWKDPLNNVIAEDGNLGPFRVVGDRPLPTLLSLISFYRVPPVRYKFLLTDADDHHWAVVGMRPLWTGGKAEIRVYSDTLFTKLEETDETPAAPTPEDRIGFAVCCLDHFSNLPVWHGVDFYTPMGDPMPIEGMAQYNSAGAIGFGRNNFIWYPGEVARVYDLPLPLSLFDPSTDTIRIVLSCDYQDTSHVADMGIALYDSKTFTYKYDNRRTAMELHRYADEHGRGGDEIIELIHGMNIIFQDDTCGLVVFAKNESEYPYTFHIDVIAPGVLGYDPNIVLIPDSVFHVGVNPTMLNFKKTVNTLGAVGVKPTEKSSWSMFVTENPAPGSLDTLASSCYGYPFTNLCLLDFERLDSVPEIMLERQSGGGARVQYNPGSGELSLGTNGPFQWKAEDIVKIWTFDLSSLRLTDSVLDYQFTVKVKVTGDAALKAGAIYPPQEEEKGEDICLGRYDIAGVFSKDSTGTFYGDAGRYGIVVWSENEASVKFSIEITQEVGVEELLPTGIPVSYSLTTISANPFNEICEICYQLPKATEVNLKIYNSAGQVVKTLVKDRKQPGSYDAVWNGRDNRGMKVPQGIYFCRFETTDYQAMRKLILLR